LPKSILVRGVPDEHAEWLSSHPGGMSQEAVLRQLVGNAYEEALSTPPAGDRRPTGIRSRFTFIDLFAGIGGFYMGMVANGGKCVFSSEWDKYANQTYREWIGGEHLDSRDIRTMDYADIPDHDVLCAGFPCQPFSIAGVSKKNALGRPHGFQDQEQGNLFFAICDIAKAKKPRVMLLENVKNLVGHDKGNTWRIINESLDALGYEVRSAVIDARSWVPQHRERIFIACFDRDYFSDEEIDAFRFPKVPEAELRLRDILEKKAPDKKYMLTPNLWKYLQDYSAKHKARGNGFGYSLVGPNDVARTLSARYYKDGSEILIKQPRWDRPRRLTPQECARLQGFNSRFSKMLGHGDAFPIVVSDMQSYKQFGNAVSPLVVEAVGKPLIKVLTTNQRAKKSVSRRKS
jgi:DNA (cytosine-5)-methyltransferase 1